MKKQKSQTNQPHNTQPSSAEKSTHVAAKHFTDEQLLAISESMLAAGREEGKDYFVAGIGEAVEMNGGIYIKNAWGKNPNK